VAPRFPTYVSCLLDESDRLLVIVVASCHIQCNRRQGTLPTNPQAGTHEKIRFEADDTPRRCHMSIMEKIQERFTAGVVYGEPVESGGSVVVPAARVMGGGGGGGDKEGNEGGGFGLSARPAGAWVIRDGEAEWKPAIDVTLIVISGLLVVMSYFRFKSRTARWKA
jgi:hypothetical protein